MNYKIVLIIAYFGKLPNYFHLWLESAKRNRDVDFLIITDIADLSESDNIKVVYSTLSQIKERADKTLNMNCVISNPYKLCDYKPAYGLIFSDLLVGYDFWGYCDLDIIWGNLRKFITNDILKTYNRLFNLGHLTIYRNDKATNRVFLKQLTGVHYTYREAYSLDYNIGFDEKGCLAGLSKNGNYIQYNNNQIIADIWPDMKRFRTFYTLTSDLNHIYTYENGSLIGHFVDGNKVRTKEFLYIHLQKRKMICNVSNTEYYMIVPNSFIDKADITVEFINAYSEDRSQILDNSEYEKQKMPIPISIVRKIRRLLFARLLKIDQL